MTLTSASMLLVSFISSAQDTPPPPMPPPPPGLPVDGAVLFLLILGLIYGIKKQMDLVKSQA